MTGTKLCAVLVSAASVLTGCAVGPDYHRPPPPAARSLAPAQVVPHDAAQDFIRGLDIPGQWWTLFHCPPLNTMVERALAANPGLPAARAALVQAREAVYAQEGSFLPNVSGFFEPSRNKNATRSVQPTAASGNPYYSLITAQLSVSYAPDVFGGQRRQVENLVATAEQQRFQLEATYLSLTANLVTAAINEASLRAQIEATRQIVAAETNLLAILRKQYALGQVAGMDALAQEAALGQSRALLPPLERQLVQSHNAMAALEGATPGEASPLAFDLDAITLPRAIPVSIPAALVDQRPDIRQSAESLRAASALVGVAIANRLPVLNLTASAGSQSNHFVQLFAQGNGFWSLAASLTQPIFEGGTLLHRERAARAALAQAEAQYRSTTITALQNVGDVLAALQSDADLLAAASATEQAASESLRIVNLQVSLGQVSYLGILNAQQTALQAKLVLVQAKAARLMDTAALFQAMGGGWWHRNDSQVRDLHGNDALAILGAH